MPKRTSKRTSFEAESEREPLTRRMQRQLRRLAHTVLGLLAVRQDELLLGIQELKASGETSGSPQLGSFGPSMQLAKELLKHGEFGSVLSYFQQCRVFWKMGGAWLDIWERKVRAGSVPNFVMHSYR